MNTKFVIGPASEPVTIEEARAHFREIDSSQDLVIMGLMKAAREQCEHIIGRAIMPQTLELTLDAFPSSNDIELQYPPAISITSIKYIAAVTGTETVLDSSQFYLDKDSEPAWVLPANGTSWPATLLVANAVRIRYQAGYASAAEVPESIKTWIKMAAAFSFEHREITDLPKDYMIGLLDRYKIWSI